MDGLKTIFTFTVSSYGSRTRSSKAAGGQGSARGLRTARSECPRGRRPAQLALRRAHPSQNSTTHRRTSTRRRTDPLETRTRRRASPACRQPASCRPAARARGTGLGFVPRIPAPDSHGHHERDIEEHADLDAVPHLRHKSSGSERRRRRRPAAQRCAWVALPGRGAPCHAEVAGRVDDPPPLHPGAGRRSGKEPATTG